MGEAKVIGEPDEDFSEGASIAWRTLRRSDITSARGTPKGGKGQFFPIYVNDENRRIEEIGEPLPHGVPRGSAPTRDGCTAVFPMRENGTEMNWGLTPDSLSLLLAEGFVKVSAHTPDKPQQYAILYLTSGRVDDIRSGRAKVMGRDSTGAAIITYVTSKVRMPLTVWSKPSHNAETGGTNMVKALLGDKRFDYPKSLYAVEDALRFFVADKKEALILDFFAGSGTSTHAVARLNRQDGGQRHSISITNNEVSESAAEKLRQQGHSPGDPTWEAEGIFENVAAPRVTAAITGKTPSGDWIDGEYKFTDEFPMADGFNENVEFFDLVYLDPDTVSRGRAFETIAPLLWLQAGASGPLIDKEMPGYAIAEPNGRYAVLFDIGRWQAFADELEKRPQLIHAFVVTDSLAAYQEVLKALPTHLEVSMLYEDYLRNFEINTGDAR
jgi:adenine-specific DNA-methyltransferase